MGPMPATGRRIAHPYCEIYHFGSDGKSIGGHAYFDVYVLLVHLGHTPAPDQVVGREASPFAWNPVSEPIR